MAYIVGNDGNATLGNNAVAHLSTWSATFSRTSTVITGFSDTVARRRLGLLDISGSAGGHLKYDAVNHSPTKGLIGTSELDGSDIVLSVSGDASSVGDTNCGYQITAVINQIAIAVDKNGDSTVTFNWEASGSVTEVWDETP